MRTAGEGGGSRGEGAFRSPSAEDARFGGETLICLPTVEGPDRQKGARFEIGRCDKDLVEREALGRVAMAVVMVRMRMLMRTGIECLRGGLDAECRLAEKRQVARSGNGRSHR